MSLLPSPFSRVPSSLGLVCLAHQRVHAQRQRMPSSQFLCFACPHPIRPLPSHPLPLPGPCSRGCSGFQVASSVTHGTLPGRVPSLPNRERHSRRRPPRGQSRAQKPGRKRPAGSLWKWNFAPGRGFTQLCGRPPRPPATAASIKTTAACTPDSPVDSPASPPSPTKRVYAVFVVSCVCPTPTPTPTSTSRNISHFSSVQLRTAPAMPASDNTIAHSHHFQHPAAT
ncbi:hypothetical protein QBC39DRAFT_185716 [Podospora conica]|nr:hypothetical protein QBC39DRAFT_185716 [Schizothecium conicum]